MHIVAPNISHCELGLLYSLFSCCQAENKCYNSHSSFTQALTSAHLSTVISGISHLGQTPAFILLICYHYLLELQMQIWTLPQAYFVQLIISYWHPLLVFSKQVYSATGRSRHSMYLHLVLGYIIIVLVNKWSPVAQSPISAENHAKYLSSPHTYRQQAARTCLCTNKSMKLSFIDMNPGANWTSHGKTYVCVCICVDHI